MVFSRTLLLIVVASIFALGLVMIFNTSSAEVLDLALERSTHHALFRQILFAGAGCALAWMVWRVGHASLFTYSLPLLAFGSCLLILVFIPGLGISANGARRWVRLFGGATVQPSEFMKYLIPLYLIPYMVGCSRTDFSPTRFLKGLGVVSLPLGLILLEPDNGTVAILTAIILVVLVVTGINMKYWVIPLTGIAIVGGMAAVNMPYVSARLKVYWNPESDLQGKGHQPHQAKIAAGSGKLLGKGPGQSLQKLSYLPEAQNDYIAAIFAEEFGFVGVTLLITLYMVMAACGFYIAHGAQSTADFCLASTVAFIIGIQAFLNLGVVSGLLPSTGLNLPFFSQGGSSLVANMGGIGLLLSISRAAQRRGASLYQRPMKCHHHVPITPQIRR